MKKNLGDGIVGNGGSCFGRQARGWRLVIARGELMMGSRKDAKAQRTDGEDGWEMGLAKVHVG